MTSENTRQAIEEHIRTRGVTKAPMGTSGKATPEGTAVEPEGKKARNPRAKGATQTTPPKHPKARRPKGIAWGSLTPRDFFREDGLAFRMGHDARLTGILKRIAAGVATPEERKLGLDSAFLDHPKVLYSAHFQPLVKAAKAAKAPKGLFAKQEVKVQQMSPKDIANDPFRG